MTPQLHENGRHPYEPMHTAARLPLPRHVVYRGRVRVVYGVIQAPHQRHRHFILRFKRGRAPRNAAQAHFGPRGQRHVVAVLVRSDHCRPLKVSTARTGSTK